MVLGAMGACSIRIKAPFLIQTAGAADRISLQNVVLTYVACLISPSIGGMACSLTWLNASGLVARASGD